MNRNILNTFGITFSSAIAVILLAATACFSGIAVDAVTTNGGQASSFTHSHTVSGCSRLLVVSVGLEAAQTVSSITYAGQSLTQVHRKVYNVTFTPATEVWRLIAPPTGTASIIVTLAGADSAAIGAISYTGVDQTTPIDGVTSAHDTTQTSGVTITSATNDLVQDVFVSLSPGASTVGAGQTSRWVRQMATTTHYGHGSTEPGAASVVMSWTMTQDSTKWVQIGSNINVAGTVVSVAVDNPTFTFGAQPLNTWLSPQTSVITNDGTVAETFIGQISTFTQGANTWVLSAAANGSDICRAQWSTTSSTGPWTDISAYATNFTIATNVGVCSSVTFWMQLQTPTATASYSQYSSTLTVTAQAF